MAHLPLETPYIQEHFSNDKIYVLGTTSFINELRKNSLTITEEVEADVACVVVAYDSELTYDKLTKACELLSTKEIPFFGTNPDLCCPIDFGFIPDCGAICQMITHATGKTPTYLGKPNPQVVDICLSASGFEKSQTLVVGDRLYTDIACGINAKVDTCVVFTGEATPEDLKGTVYKPTYSVLDVKELFEKILHKK